MTDHLPDVQLTPEQTARARALYFGTALLGGDGERAARLIVHLQDEVANGKALAMRLRQDLADPPPDVQDLVFKKHGDLIADNACLQDRLATELTPTYRYELWRHLHHEHGLTLMESELDEIARLAAPAVKPAHEREPPHCSSCSCGLPAEPPADAHEIQNALGYLRTMELACDARDDRQSVTYIGQIRAILHGFHRASVTTETLPPVERHKATLTEDERTALDQIRRHLIEQFGKSHQGYFSAPGWAGHVLTQLLMRATPTTGDGPT